MISFAITFGYGINMASISVRKLDDQVIRQLRIRAAANGVSMEQEVRQILTTAVSAPDRLGDLALSLFGPTHGVDLQIPERNPHNPINFDE